MIENKTYLDLKGRVHSLTHLDSEESKLLSRIQRKARACPDWNDFDNFWLNQVASFYKARGLSRQQIIQTTVYRIAQDLSSRLGIAAGKARVSDYRDELGDLIRSRFKTQSEFCKATGLAPDMLSHVLAGRKHLAIESLQQALDRIGYALRIVPFSEKITPGRKRVRA